MELNLSSFLDTEALKTALVSRARNRFLSQASAYTNEKLSQIVLDAAEYITAEVSTGDNSISVRLDNTYAAEDEDVRQEIELIMREVETMENSLTSNDIEYMLSQNVDKIGEQVAEQIIEPMLTGG